MVSVESTDDQLDQTGQTRKWQNAEEDVKSKSKTILIQNDDLEMTI